MFLSFAFVARGRGRLFYPYLSISIFHFFFSYEKHIFQLISIEFFPLSLLANP